MYRMFQLLTLSFLLVLSTAVFSAKVESPKTIKGVTLIDVAKAKELHAKGILFVDVRKKLEYADGRIPKAFFVPYKEKSKKIVGYDASKDKFNIAKVTSKLGDKTKEIVFYCNGIFCWKSYKASLWAHKDGYKKIYWLRGGFPAWQKSGSKIEK